ncbi:hypothetical protein J6590_079321 [Homalodisca vitripennis]|nr:hypothetical protein J6590_079321 [Homalodisca vitripennis]
MRPWQIHHKGFIPRDTSPHAWYRSDLEATFLIPSASSCTLDVATCGLRGEARSRRARHSGTEAVEGEGTEVKEPWRVMERHVPNENRNGSRNRGMENCDSAGTPSPTGVIRL